MSPRNDDPVHRLQREVERLFHGLAYQRHPASHFGEALWAPAADLVVSEHSARVMLELAGVPRENVKVRLIGRTLEISGRRQPPQDPGDVDYHRAEIIFGDFERSIELPWEADVDRVDARYHDGMLEIRLVRASVAAPTHVAINPDEPA